MIVTINNETVKLPDSRISVEDVLALRNVKKSGTAVAINNRLVKQDKWNITFLNDADNITIISAAFGG